jgi:endo-1,4-beta-xylanase
MVKELNEKNPNVGGRPLIDGIGMQGHYRISTNMNNVAASLEQFISLGVEVSVTELDVQAGAGSTMNERQTIEQGIAYAQLFRLFKDHADSIGRITVWGLEDSSSWRSATNPTLFDKDLKAKAAFHGALNPDTYISENEAVLAGTVKQAEARYGSPALTVDDPAWSNAVELPVNQYLMAWQGASGTVKVLWDERNLYVLVKVLGAELNRANPAPHEQDSVEVFVDENNGKTAYYEQDDGQYRVNFAGDASFNPAAASQGFESAAFVEGKSYTVLMKIPFKTVKPDFLNGGGLIGFDVQINGASAQGARQSAAVWNDVSGESFQSTSGLGILKLVK